MGSVPAKLRLSWRQCAVAASLFILVAPRRGNHRGVESAPRRAAPARDGHFMIASKVSTIIDRDRNGAIVPATTTLNFDTDHSILRSAPRRSPRRRSTRRSSSSWETSRTRPPTRSSTRWARGSSISRSAAPRARSFSKPSIFRLTSCRQASCCRARRLPHPASACRAAHVIHCRPSVFDDDPARARQDLVACHVESLRLARAKRLGVGRVPGHRHGRLPLSGPRSRRDRHWRGHRRHSSPPRPEPGAIRAGDPRAAAPLPRGSRRSHRRRFFARGARGRVLQSAPPPISHVC